MDTLLRIDSTEVGEGEAETEGEGDGASQRHILKETEVAVTSNSRSTTPGAWERSQVLGFKPHN